MEALSYILLIESLKSILAEVIGLGLEGFAVAMREYLLTDFRVDEESYGESLRGRATRHNEGPG